MSSVSPLLADLYANKECSSALSDSLRSSIWYLRSLGNGREKPKNALVYWVGDTNPASGMGMRDATDNSGACAQVAHIQTSGKSSRDGILRMAAPAVAGRDVRPQGISLPRCWDAGQSL